MADLSQSEVLVGEGRPEAQTANPVVEQAQEAFDTAAAPKEQSVYDARMEAWQKVVNEIPADQRDGLKVKLADFGNKISSRVDDISSHVIDAVKDYNPGALIWRGLGKSRGVDVPTGQYSDMRKSVIRGQGEVTAEMQKQNVQNYEDWKKIIPGGKVLDITDRILGPTKVMVA